MDICGNSCLCHLPDHFVALLSSLSWQSGQIEMTTGLVIFAIMLQHLDIQILKPCIISFYNLPASFQQLGISSELCQSQRSHDICHIVFIIRRYDIIFPASRFCFCQGIFRLSVERIIHKLFVKVITGDSRDFFPYSGSSLCGGKILHRVEGKTGKICDFSAHLSFLSGSEGMGSVCQHSNPAQSLLDRTRGFKKPLVFFCDLIYLIIIWINDSAQIHADHSFCSICNCFPDFLRIHIIGSWNCVYQNRSCSHMAYHAAAGSVSIGRCDHLISRTYPQYPKA